MTQNPDELRADIELTRRRLGTNIDAVADKVTPSHVIHRKVDRIKDAVFGAREDMQETAGGAVRSAQDAVSDVAENIGDAPRIVARKTQGSPVAAGLIAFGAGLLLSALFPPTEKEREAAEAVKEAAQPLTAELGHAAQEVAGNLQQPAMDAVQNVRESASEAVGNIQDEGLDAAADVQDRAQAAKENLGGQ
ncbi:DUF3618 domain-containing protein [Arthrobacter sp. NyZ413]|uniref:DUF3618 domain-containing protein n=1 Tax=Arthrobacter sp. NyZ413 TaxID=3144669 RepID=UPI002C11147F|nr:DUF3618 domain-containing protein [Arthrobacter sp.]